MLMELSMWPFSQGSPLESQAALSTGPRPHTVNPEPRPDEWNLEDSPPAPSERR